MSRKIGLFLGVTPGMGGVFQYSVCLLHALAALPAGEFETVVGYTDGVWESPVREKGLNAFRVPAPGWSLALGTLVTWAGLPIPLWRGLSRAADPAVRRLRAERCDLWVFSAYSFVCYQMPVPSVGVIHDLMHRYEPRFSRDFRPGVCAWRERVFRRVCRWSRAVLVDSDMGRRQAAESYGADPERFHVLPYVAPPVADGGREPADFDARLKVPRKFLFYPAQFWEHKNHPRLFEAVARLRSSLPDIHLVLAGSRSRGYEACAAQVARLGLDANVTFLGYVPDRYMPGLYRRARALIMPTFFGPTNIPPLEAFALGCPVAVSGVYGMPEQVGDAALLFDPGSVDEIAAAAQRLWTDDALCAELSRRGRLRHRAWGQDAFNRRFEHILRKVAK